MLALALLFLAVSTASAHCPNSCSNHGVCGHNDICQCWSNFQGSDCSLRTCPSGNSWALDSLTPHDYEECSGAGLCNRATGECGCFQGYTGFACQRLACPNDCSGHGVCLTLSSIKATVPYPSSNWDASRIQACQCDKGFFGTDCSQRLCPTGDDPLTICPTTSMGGQVQSITVTLGSRLNHATLGDAGAGATDSGMDLFGTSDAAGTTAVAGSSDLVQLRVGATDAYSHRWTSRTAAKSMLSQDTTGEASLKVALENTPGVGAVTVSGALTTGSTPYGAYVILEKAYSVTFVPDYVSSVNVGKQNLLVCDSGYGCTGAGCAPMVRMPFLYRYAALGSPVAALTAAPNSATFYTGPYNTAAAFAAGSFVRLHPDSSPRLPLGMAPDATLAKPADATGVRYDARLLVAAMAPTTPGSTVSVFWTRVVYGNANITSDAFDYASGSGFAGVWEAAKMGSYSPSLLGFTYQGTIPASKRAVIPEAPGMILHFGTTAMVASAGSYSFYEILVKLPSCAVAVTQDVDARVENVECSNRGQCDRATGLCSCFQGYYSVACNRQTTQI